MVGGSFRGGRWGRRGIANGCLFLLGTWLASCGKSHRHPVTSPNDSAGQGGNAGHSGGGNAGKGAGGTGGRAGRAGGAGIDAAAGAGEGGMSAGGAGAHTAAGDGDGGVSSPGGASGAAGEASGRGGQASTLCRSTRSPSPELPAPTALDPSDVARAAVLIGSCWDDDGVNRNAAHLWHAHLAASTFYYRVGTELSCVVNADCGCDAIDHCFGFDVAPVASCTPGCNGANFTGCGSDVDLPDGYRVTFDCDSVGLSCDAAAICIDGPAVSCDEASFVPGCAADGRTEYCARGVVAHGRACGDFGLSCVDGACVGTGAACDANPFGGGQVIEFVGSGCSGDVLESCVGDKTATLDCTTQGPGFGCREHDGAFFCGLAAECTPATEGSDSGTAASCDGTVLTFCNAGRIEHVDCTSLGFTGCDIDTSVGHYGCVPRQFE